MAAAFRRGQKTNFWGDVPLMKLQFISTLPAAYIQDRYALAPDLAALPSASQKSFLLNGFQKGVHVLAQALSLESASCLVSLCGASKYTSTFATEHSLSNGADDFSIILFQTDTFHPDIIVIEDPKSLSREQLNELKTRAKGLVTFYSGQRTDFEPFDLVFVFDPDHREVAIQNGAKRVEVLVPFVPDIYFMISSVVQRSFDLSFLGYLSPSTPERLAILTSIGKAPLGWGGEFSIRYSGETSQREFFPVGVTMHHYGAHWGVDSLRVAFLSKTAISFGEEEHCSLSEILEPFCLAAGGAALVAKHGSLITKWLGDNSISQFRFTEEALEAIYYLLKTNEAREEQVFSAREALLKRHNVASQANTLLGCCRMVVKFR